MANPLYGQNKADNILDVMIKSVAAKESAVDGNGANLISERFIVLGSGNSGSASQTFSITLANDVKSVLFGYFNISGSSGDVDIDIGDAGSGTSQFTGAGASILWDTDYAINGSFQANGESILITFDATGTWPVGDFRLEYRAFACGVVNS